VLPVRFYTKAGVFEDELLPVVTMEDQTGGTDYIQAENVLGKRNVEFLKKLNAYHRNLLHR
jgi:hypothetical protein